MAVIGIAVFLGVLILVGEYMNTSSPNSASDSGSSSGPNASSSLTSALATAIATAEGFFVGGSLPSQANNPGDLEIAGAGVGVGSNQGKTIFASADDGWNALYNQIDLMLTGQSSIYSPDMTISQVAQLYTGGDNADAWANNVASQLGVTPDTTLSELQAQYGGE
ncbi:MAG TPA: hypothetical protein VGY31_03455 [Terriglobia bacterium]|nr:hypothetical protein [Terriglobia bacterium]